MIEWPRSPIMFPWPWDMAFYKWCMGAEVMMYACPMNESMDDELTNLHALWMRCWMMVRQTLNLQVCRFWTDLGGPLHRPATVVVNDADYQLSDFRVIGACWTMTMVIINSNVDYMKDQHFAKIKFKYDAWIWLYVSSTLKANNLAIWLGRASVSGQS